MAMMSRAESGAEVLSEPLASRCSIWSVCSSSSGELSRDEFRVVSALVFALDIELVSGWPPSDEREGGTATGEGSTGGVCCACRELLAAHRNIIAATTRSRPQRSPGLQPFAPFIAYSRV